MRYLRLHTLGFAVLLVALTVIHCAPTEVQADRRRRWTTYGATERGRLVVECDMRSATCSDGRRITTTRFTPVPCEVSPGVWEMVPEDTGCYSVRGLESWRENTSYLAYGTELDREPWRIAGQATLEKLDGFYRLSGPVGSNLVQTVGDATEQTTYTFACILRGDGQVRLNFGGPQVMSLSPEWRQYSRTASIPAGGVIAPRIYTGDGSSTSDPVDIIGCWLTRTSTPGRPCWGGEAPVTCAADRHTISTEGWPTEAGEVELVFHYGQVIGRPERMFDGRSSGDLEHYTLFISSFPGNPLTLSLDQTVIVQSSSLSWVAENVYRVRVRRTMDGEIELFRDGVRVAADSGPPLSWSPRAALGSRYDGSQHLDGSIRSLRIRNYEEVSP